MKEFLFFLLGASVFAAGWWRTYKKMTEYRAVCTETLEELESSNAAWEKGQDDLVELYDMQLLTANERLEEAEETAVELFEVFQGQERIITDLRATARVYDEEIQRLAVIVRSHDQNCLPHVGLA